MWKRLLVVYRDHVLFRHLLWVLVIKVALLWMLWLILVQPQRQHPDSDAVLRHLTRSSEIQASTTLTGALT